MSGYQRFIAYVYEYQKNKKGSNCGFVKVEIKNQRCRIELHLHCVGIPPESECRTYGFLRKDGLMNGILLGSCQTEADSVECILETDSLNMADSGIPFEKIGGFVLITQSGGFFGTEWDDQPVRPDNFREIKAPVLVPVLTPVSAPVLPQEPEHSDEAPAAAEEPDTVTAESLPEESAPETVTENTSPEPSDLTTDDTPTVNQPKDTVDTTAENPPDTLPSETPDQDTPDDSAVTKQDTSISAPGEEFLPFDDVEFIKCWKIHPNDLARCAPRVRSLRNNRFLQYGFYNFGHLLLGQRSNGKYILGIPGGYDQQERFMANMFGFPFFKECRQIELPKNRGGYWYRSIDTPNFH